jgi:hypothetical protein
MGNRAVITFSTANNAPAIYLHWNGGRASVEGFLTAARQLGLRHAPTAQAQTEALDQLAEMLARFYFRCNVGMTVYRLHYAGSDRDNGDNGTYLIGRDLTIIDRLFKPRAEEINREKTAAIIEQITAAAPIFNLEK